MTERNRLIALALLVSRESAKPREVDKPTLRLDGLAQRAIERGQREETSRERESWPTNSNAYAARMAI